MTKDLNKESGRRGEKIAARYLHEHGYKVVERNYRTSNQSAHEAF